jgi:hypothetical protein
MKIQAFALTAALAFPFTSCEQKPASSAAVPAPAAAVEAPPVPAVDPKVAFGKALDAFAAELNALRPAEMVKKVPVLLTKLESIPTTGLPEDLVAAFSRVIKGNHAMGLIFASLPSGLPSDPAEFPAYMQANPEVMKTMMELQTKMAPLKVEADAAEKEFEAAATKNGLDISNYIKAGKAMNAE